MYWGQGCSVDRNLEVHTSLLPYWTFGLRAVNDVHNFRVDTASRKDNEEQNISKMIMWYRSVYNQTASDAWRYNNPVYKLTTDKQQLMVINVLLYQFLNIKVSQDSVATRLRCGGIFNDQFIIQPLLSPRVKQNWKSVNICRSCGQLSTGLFFFLWNTVYMLARFALCGVPVHLTWRCSRARLLVQTNCIQQAMSTTRICWHFPPPGSTDWINKLYQQYLNVSLRVSSQLAG